MNLLQRIGLGMVILASMIVASFASGQPAYALAEERITTCDWQSLNAALTMVQDDSDGGTIAFDCNGTINVAATTTITNTVTIDGNGHDVNLVGDVVPFDLAIGRRFFTVEDTGDLTLHDLELKSGYRDEGGAIQINGASLSVSNVVFTGNTINPFSQTEGSNYGGAIYNNAGDVTVDESLFDANLAGAGRGGAIYNASRGTVSITSSSFLNNRGTVNGGAIANVGGTLSIVGSSFTGNVGSLFFGGAIYNNDGETTISASEFSENSSGFYGGAIATESGDITISASEFTANETDNGGGALYSKFGTTSISASTFSSNKVLGPIGGGPAGAILNDNSNLTINTSTFNDNKISGFGAGGAIVNRGTAHISASTFVNNSAGSGGAGAFYHSSGSATITASTFVGNSGAFSGAIITEANLRISASTIVGNSARFGNAITNAGGTLRISASIVAENISTGELDANCAGDNLTSDGYNLSDDRSCSFTAPGDNQSANVNLADLANNGGPTMTMLPRPGSDAINNIPAEDCNLSTATDQRGVARPQGQSCDSGAVEVRHPAISTLTQTGPAQEPATIDISFTATTGEGGGNTYALDCGNDGDFEIDLGLATSGACSFGDDGVYPVGVMATDQLYGEPVVTTRFVDVTITNVSPTITGTSVSKTGNQATITVNASDPADASVYPFTSDPLQYSFDCDDNGSYEVGPLSTNSANCNLSSAKGIISFSVLVEDGDGGSVTAQTDPIIIPYDLCANRYNGDLRMPRTADCGPTEILLTLPEDGPLTLCVNRYNGDVRYSRSGRCGGTEFSASVIGDGSFAVCVNCYNRDVRAPRVPDQCGSTEVTDTL